MYYKILSSIYLSMCAFTCSYIFIYPPISVRNIQSSARSSVNSSQMNGKIRVRTDYVKMAQNEQI